MRLAVCVKHAIDESELKTDGSGRPIIEGAASRMSAFDKNAVEEAVRLKSALGGEVVVFTVGISEAKKTLKEALAMGADAAVHVVADVTRLDALATSELLARAIRKAGDFDLILCSEGSSDVYTGEVPPMLGERLGIPFVGFARKIVLSGETARVERSLEDKVEVVESPLPLVTSVVSEINEPRYPTLIQIMQASKKPMEEVTAQQLGVAATEGSVQVLSMNAQSTDRKRVLYEGAPDDVAAKLVDALFAEGVIPGRA